MTVAGGTCVFRFFICIEYSKKKMEKNKKYTLGLDIGTSSVGWAIVDESGKIPCFQGKNLWGVRLFDSANTAESRRLQRGARRRYLRRRRRLELLQSLFQDEISKIDKNFFEVKVEKETWLKDKPVEKNGENYANFENKSLAEVLKSMGKSSKEYKNIYFLQKDIIDKDEKIDLRLLYLAIYANVKYRGHFLSEFDFKSVAASVNLERDIAGFLNMDDHGDDLISLENICLILKSNKRLAEKKKKLAEIAGDDKVISEKLNLLAGSRVDISKIFIEGDYEGKKFSVDLSDEDPFKDYDISDEDMEILNIGYKVFLKLSLEKVLGEEENICSAQVNAYKEFNSDLKKFKRVVRNHLKNDKYKKIFGENGILDIYLRGKNWNSKNSGEVEKKSGERIKDQAYKELVKVLRDIKSDDEDVKALKEKEEAGVLFLKQRSKINRSIPHQLKAKDVYDMMKRQQQFYPFITEELIDKVVKLITYRIPYYIGPLIKGEGSPFGWATRDSDEKITPWNIDEVINKDKTAEDFINKLINKCTILYSAESSVDTKVLPAKSLSYQIYTVYNELNGIRLIDPDGKARLLTRDEREKIIEEGFKKNNELKLDKAKKILGKGEGVILKGAQDKDKFASSLSTYKFFKKFIDEPLNHVPEIDEIVRILTVFNEDEIINKRLSRIEIAKDRIKEIKKLKVSGWGRLCSYLLNDMKHQEKSILEYLKMGDDRRVINLQHLISTDKYSFKKQIDEINTKKNMEICYEDVEELAGSPALKRGVWQTIQIVDELINKFKINIKTIAIEFAGGDEKKKRSTSFEEKFKKISEHSLSHAKVGETIYKIDYTDKKQQLYLLQEGKCLYTGEPLDFTSITGKDYEIDHIRARSFTKDNSIDNLALVLVQCNQQKEDNNTPLEIIQESQRLKMIAWWRKLLEVGAISQIKFQRLTKEKFSDKELDRFLQRTLVETRQIGKHVKELLGNYFGDEIEIYNISAQFTDNFRKKLEIPKVRNLTQKHHCQDAYMLSVVTSYTLRRFGKDFFELGKENKKFFYIDAANKLTSRDRSNIIIASLISGGELTRNSEMTDPITYFKNEMDKDFLISYRLSYAGSMELWKETNFSKKDKKNKYEELTRKWKYAKDGFQAAYMLLVEYDKKKGKKYTRERRIIKVDHIIDKYYDKNPQKYNDIVNKLCDEKNLSVIRKIEIGQIIEEGGYRFLVKSDKEKSNFNEFSFSEKEIIAFHKLCNENIYEIDKSQINEFFEIIKSYVKRNFKWIFGEEKVANLEDKFNENIFGQKDKKFNDEYKRKLQNNYKKNDLGEYLGIDLKLTDAQLQMLNEPSGNNDEIINDLASIYSNGNPEIKAEVLRKIEDAVMYHRERIYKESISEFAKEVIQAISIGAGRSDKLSIGRLGAKIKMEARIVHQSVTGIEEEVTEALKDIPKKRILRDKP